MMFASIMMRSSRLLIVSVLVILFASHAYAAGLRKSSERNLQDSQLCNIQWVDIQFDDGTPPVKELKCLVDGEWNGYNNGIDDFAYSITLPDSLLKQNDEAIRSGTLYIAIPGGEIVDDDGTAVPYVTVPDASLIAIVPYVVRRRDRQLQGTQYNPVLVVRVSTDRGDSCDPSADSLAGSVFGIGGEALQHSMKSQYEDCSNGQQSFTPITGTGVVNGVVEVTISIDIQGKDIFSLTNEMNRATNDAVGSSLNYSPRHVMYCVPYGTTFENTRNWVAFAYVNGVSSYFNNDWCDRLSSQMHEIGHNLGMQHSNENGGEYGDQSGLMGFSYPERNGPLMCFNAFKHWMFGWYSSQERTITGGWTGELVAFTDAQLAPTKDVILNVGDIYMQLNRRKGKNSGTREKADEVVLVQGSTADKQSNVLAGLGSGEKYSVGGLTVEVCYMSFYTEYDYAQVSIYAYGGSSGCSSTKGSTGGSCQDDNSKYFVVDGYVRTCAWVAIYASNNCNDLSNYYCKATCNQCP